MLTAAKNEEPGNEKVYLYLAFSYEQLGQHAQAAEVLKEGLGRAVLYKQDFYLNLGNNYYKLNQMSLAEEMFSQAIQTNPRFSEAYLNRANSSLRQDKHQEALADYRIYLALAPEAPQKEKIEKIISLLTGYIAEEELRRAEAEQKAREEEERRKALLESVMETLGTIGSDTQNLSADSEEIIEQSDGLDILD